MPNNTHRQRTREGLGLGARARTESMIRLTKRELVSGRVHLQLLEEGGDVPERPRTRGECVGGARPCPWVSCRHNLYLDVADSDSIKYNFPDLEPDEVPPEKSCALDVADAGGATLEDVGQTMNVTRERIRQIESKAIGIVQRQSANRHTTAAVLREFTFATDETMRDAAGRVGHQGGSAFAPREVGADDSEEDEDDEPPTRISFFAEPESERIDELVAANVWRMFVRDSNSRGFLVHSNYSRAATARLAFRRTKRPKEDLPMMNGHAHPELSPRLAGILAAYNELSKNGEKPTAAEVGIKANVFGDTDKQRAANVYTALSVLRKKGLLEAADSDDRKPPSPRKAAPPPTNRPETAPPSPSRKSSRDPVVASLIEKRDELRRKADALDTAIEALSEVL